MQTGFSLLWKRSGTTSRILLSEGLLRSSSDLVTLPDSTCRQDFLVAQASRQTLVTVSTTQFVFTFRLGDISAHHPIWIDALDVAVLELDDRRTWQTIAVQRGKTVLLKIESEPETNFQSIASQTRFQIAPTWLGLGRDARIFKIACSTDRTPMESDLIWPRQGSSCTRAAGFGARDVVYGFIDGRGQGARGKVRRFLEEDSLPILHKHREDGDVVYDSTFLVTLLEGPLSEDAVEGTHYLQADAWTYGCTQTEQEKQKVSALQSSTSASPLLCIRLLASNHGTVARYAWFKTLRPGSSWADQPEYRIQDGFSVLNDNSVFCFSRFNGQAFTQPEIAVLLSPGETACLEMYLPHSPVSREYAETLASRPFERAFYEVRDYWKKKLSRNARLEVPEKRVRSMVRAGIQHLELATYGENPEGPLAPTVGCYCPIGTESAPIIQSYDSFGRHDLARRCLEFFLAKQREDGSMRNFGGYMGETGAVLWTLGEHFRYTRDSSWVESILPNIRRAAGCLIELRKGDPSGLIAGRVADPDDPYRQFMLNGYSYLGLARAAEMTREVNVEFSEKLAAEAAAWRADIRRAFFNAMEHAPVIPLGDGRWLPSAPPWMEERGPRALYLNSEPQFSHGSFTVADSLLGPLHLVFCEVLEPDEPVARTLLEVHSELFCEENTALSQPYYSRHDWLQLRLGMVKGFLKTWYASFAALADRETYTFWEHFHGVTEHKTHEEAWFLMATRWMLYQELGDTLVLLGGIPRRWFKEGCGITVEKAGSYFVLSVSG